MSEETKTSNVGRTHLEAMQSCTYNNLSISGTQFNLISLIWPTCMQQTVNSELISDNTSRTEAVLRKSWYIFSCISDR